jgi:hypothetical protein
VVNLKLRVHLVKVNILIKMTLNHLLLWDQIVGFINSQIVLDMKKAIPKHKFYKIICKIKSKTICLI